MGMIVKAVSDLPILSRFEHLAPGAAKLHIDILARYWFRGWSPLEDPTAAIDHAAETMVRQYGKPESWAAIVEVPAASLDASGELLNFVGWPRRGVTGESVAIAALRRRLHRAQERVAMERPFGHVDVDVAYELQRIAEAALEQLEDATHGE